MSRGPGYADERRATGRDEAAQFCWSRTERSGAQRDRPRLEQQLDLQVEWRLRGRQSTAQCSGGTGVAAIVLDAGRAGAMSARRDLDMKRLGLAIPMQVDFALNEKCPVGATCGPRWSGRRDQERHSRWGGVVDHGERAGKRRLTVTVCCLIRNWAGREPAGSRSAAEIED